MTLRNRARASMLKSIRGEGAFYCLKHETDRHTHMKRIKVCFGGGNMKGRGWLRRRIYEKKEWKCVKWLSKVSAEMEFDTYTFMRINLIHEHESNVKKARNAHAHTCAVLPIFDAVSPPSSLHSSSPISISHIIFDSIFSFALCFHSKSVCSCRTFFSLDFIVVRFFCLYSIVTTIIHFLPS